MKKRIALASAILVVGAGVGVMALNSPQPTGADTSPIGQQVQQNTDELANHEARITNTENNVKDLQDKTNTPPSTTQVEVPASPTESISSPAVQTTPTVEPSTPVKVTDFKQIPLDGGNVDCQLTYSDGTTYQWHWQTVNPHGSWQTRGDGSDGHWVQTTSINGTCDSSVVGQTK